MPYTRIGVDEARRLIEEDNARVVDVRDRGSFEAGHIEGAESVDESNLRDFLAKNDFRQPLIVCCYHGNMSQGAADYFNRQGFERTYSLDGGWEAWASRQAVSHAPAPAVGGLDALPDSTRLWIYGADRRLGGDEIGALEAHMDRFLAEWRSHGREIEPAWALVHDQFLIVGVDETAIGLSGCSIDSMFRAVEGFGGNTGVRFARGGNEVFYRDADGGVRSVDRLAFSNLARGGSVSADTIVFDNTVASAADYRAGRWEVPVRESWHMKAFAKSLGAAERAP